MVKKRNLTTAAPKKGVTNRRQPMPTESSVDEEDFVSELSSPESLSSHESPSSNVDGSSLASSEAGETTGIRPLGSSESGGNPGPLESSIGPEQEDPLGIKKIPLVLRGDNVVGNATSSVVPPTSLPSHRVSDSSLLVSSLLNKDNVDPSVPLSREVEESLRQLQTVLAQHKTRAEEAKRQFLEQQQKTANLSMTERALAVEQQTGYVSRPHRDAVPNDLIPFVSPYDQSVSISDYDLWHLAKFAPWHPTLRHRMPAGRHYLLKNVPPGTSPQAIKQFLGDLYDSRAGDTYRFPSTYSWDPRHGIIIEPLVQIFSADGQSVSYEYSAWYLHSLNNKRKLYHNVSVSTEWLPTGHQYSHLPAATRVLDSLSTSPQDVDSVPVQPFSGIGGSQLVLPLASQAMCEKATFAPNLSDLNGLDSVQRFFPGEVYRPEQVDRFTHGLRDGISTQNFEAQFGGEERFISLEEHESVYRKPEGFAKGCDESMSMALSSEQLAQNRKNHVAHMTRSRKTPKRSNSIEISDLTSQSKSPLAELSDVTDSMSEDSSSEDEEPNVLADTPIILSGVPQRKDRTKKKSISKKSRPSCLKSESREDIIKFIHEFSYWAIHVRKQSNRKDFDTRLGIAPINKFDLVRLTLLEIDPTGVSEFIDRQLLSDWKLLNVPGPDSNITEKDLWFRLVLLSQYTSTTQAMGDLKNLRLSQSNDPSTVMNRYLKLVINILKCSTAISLGTGRTFLPASISADLVLCTLNPQKEIAALNDLQVKWEHTLKNNEHLLPEFLSEVKTAWIDYKRSMPTTSFSNSQRRSRDHSRGNSRFPRKSFNQRYSKPSDGKSTDVECFQMWQKGHYAPDCRKSQDNAKSNKRRSGDSRPDSRSRSFKNHKSPRYIFKIDNAQHNSNKNTTPLKYTNPLATLITQSSMGKSVSSVGTIRSLNQNLGFETKGNGPLCIRLLINNVPVVGEFDSAASCSVISQDLIRYCEMTTTDSCIEYISANNIRATSLGSAIGVLTFNVGSLANQIHVKHTLPVVPGTKILLIGRDLQEELGLLSDDGLVIRLDKEHRTILNAESEFDERMRSPSISINRVQSKCSINQHSTHFPIDQYGNTQLDINLFEETIDNSGCTIELDDPTRRTELLSLLSKYKQVFSEDVHPDGIDCPPMTIPFYDESVTVFRPPRRLNPEKQRIAEEIFNELIRQGWAVPSTGKFSSPIVLVVYNDHRKPRLTEDFSGPDGINANTRPVKPNLPRICDVLEFLSKANFIGTLDLPKAFWQLNVAEEDVEKTSVSIPGMSISFKRACFGLKNVPAIFQNIMMEIFNVEGVFIYIDDIIVVGNTFEEFISRINLVLERAERFRVRIGLKKCRFTTSKHPNKILGSNFCNKTRCIDDKRVSALIELPAPLTLPEVRSLLGALNYVREWIPNYSNLTASINELTHGKPKKIAWTKDHDALLDKIKTEIINHMALDLPDTDKNIIMSTDASDIAVGGVIWQEENPPAPPGTPLEERRVRPVSFYSRLLNDSQQNWAAFQKELYAILLILTESSLEGFLLSRHLTIFTDHRNLAYLISAPEKNRIVKRWIPILSEFDFEIEHIAGTNNQWADMLSRVIDRRPVETIKSLLISNHTIRNDIILSHEGLIYDEADYVEMLPCNTNILAIKSLQDLSSYNKLPLFDSWLSTIRAEQHKAINEGDRSTVSGFNTVYYEQCIHQLQEQDFDSI
ncbi:hypothetical protein GEMRC1_014211 [Eukaryota sp. GEM-RC1]